jgi:hypothetical protein
MKVYKIFLEDFGLEKKNLNVGKRKNSKRRLMEAKTFLTKNTNFLFLKLQNGDFLG